MAKEHFLWLQRRIRSITPTPPTPPTRTQVHNSKGTLLRVVLFLPKDVKNDRLGCSGIFPMGT